jgi:hypothetical protein
LSSQVQPDHQASSHRSQTHSRHFVSSHQQCNYAKFNPCLNIIDKSLFATATTAKFSPLNALPGSLDHLVDSRFVQRGGCSVLEFGIEKAVDFVFGKSFRW